MSNAVFLIREKIFEEIETDVEERCYAIRTNEKLGLTVNPYPINKEDVLGCKREVEDNFEHCLDDHEKLRSILEDQENVCQVHMKMETVNLFKQLIKNLEWIMEEVEVGNVVGITQEHNSPFRESTIVLDKEKVEQGNKSGSVDVIEE